MKYDKNLMQALQAHHRSTIWVHFANLFLGFWLLTGHAVFGYSSDVMAKSDMISGVIVILFSLLSLSFKRTFAPWMVCLVGLWLQFAPLVFWAKDSVAYASDTLIGALLIVFSLLVPGVPGALPSTGPSVPPGWSYNPSSWMQRIPIICFGCIGWFIARALAAYQLGYIDHIWDPFFGHGTVDVITSSVSKAFPVPDAGLGALAYTLEALMGCKGDDKRWRTMPWIVVGFGILVVPLGLVSIILVILQPLVVGAWCTLCLCTATAMLIMISLTVDEMIAVLQYLSRVRKTRQDFWKIFWRGGQDALATNDTRTPAFSGSYREIFSSMKWGISVTWNLLISALIGFLVMALPNLFQFEGALADVDHVLGALIVTISVISMAEVVRIGRFINIIFGAVIVLASFLVEGAELWTSIIHILVAIVLILISFKKGEIQERYGKWEKFIR